MGLPCFGGVDAEAFIGLAVEFNSELLRVWPALVLVSALGKACVLRFGLRVNHSFERDVPIPISPLRHCAIP